MLFRINEFIYIYSFVAYINTSSRSLQLITNGTDDCISAIDNSAKHELQLSIINSKLPCKNLSHQKCVTMLHDQFDRRKKQKCVRFFHDFNLFNFNIHFQKIFCLNASCRSCIKNPDGLSGTLSTNHHTLKTRT
jgi:hypothetical protein